MKQEKTTILEPQDRRIEAYVAFAICSTFIGITALIGVFFGKSGLEIMGLSVACGIIIFMMLGMNTCA